MLTIEEISSKADSFTTLDELESFKYTLFRNLTDFHVQKCSAYKRIVESFFQTYRSSNHIEELPYIPIGLFKQMDLISAPQSTIVTTLNSSGTSGNTSRVYLDKITAINQIKVLTNIFFETISTKKMPLIVIDSGNNVVPSRAINARSAAVKGFSIFASEVHYVLDKNSDIQLDQIAKLAEKFGESEILFFGFTFVIWKNLLKELESNNIKFTFKKGTLVHGGGWKNLESYKVSNEIFNNCAKDRLGVMRVLNYYGMAEQTGSIYFECAASFLHTTHYGHIIIRNYQDFSVAKVGEEGIVQLLSVVPTSYPGHSILTEDIGVILGDDGCKCGKSGRYFKILGRLPEAEIRGCGDAYGNE
jgi:phenylacetate-coenzyme A ligase PaaK-like adenylate-forming protein